MMAPPTTATNAPYIDEQPYNRILQRPMRLDDISETDNLITTPKQQRNITTPKENLLNLTQLISNQDLKQAIRIEIKRLVTDYDRLISMLQQRSEVLEQEYENLQMTEDSYQKRYEKAVREMQFFKKKYEKSTELNKQYTATVNRPTSPSLDTPTATYGGGNMPITPPSSSISGSSSAEGTTHNNSPIYNLPFPPPLPNSPLPSTSSLSHTEKARHLSRSSSSSTTSSNASGAPYWSTAYTSSELPPAPPLPPPVPRIRKNSISGSPNVASNIHSSSAEESSKNGSYNSASRKGSWQQMQSQPPPPLPSPPPPPTTSASPIPASSVSSPPPNNKTAQRSTTATTTTIIITPTAPATTPTTTPTTTTSGSSQASNPQVIQQRKVDPIAFGGSDALWETIAKSKTADTTIEKMISNFLRRGGSPNTAKQSPSYKAVKYGYGMLHTLIAIKASTSMDLLLTHGANPNAMTLSQAEEDKVTPGYLAASIGWLQGLQTLIEAGADILGARGAGVKNKSALHVAAEHCHTTVVEYIVSLTPPRYHLQIDSMGASALHYAAASGHTDLVLFLVQNCQLPVDQEDIRGETPLHWASRHGHLEVASLLIERCGCDFNAYIPRKAGTPYDLAKAGGHKRLIEYYKKIGALTSKKMDKKREEELEKNVPVHLESALSKNGLFGF